jgi:hypothetical protein
MSHEHHEFTDVMISHHHEYTQALKIITSIIL